MKFIFRSLIAALLAILPAELSAQNSALLERLYDTFSSSCVVMRCEYSISADGLTSRGDCVVEVQGTCYKMQGNGLEILCDGQSVWVLDEMAKEAIVEPVSNDSFSYMSNPALLFRDMEKVFTMTGASSIASGIIYQLSARKSCGIKNAVLLINHDAALRYAEFVLDDNSLMKIDVLSEKVLPLKASGHFRPADLSSDWIITDLRGF